MSTVNYHENAIEKLATSFTVCHNHPAGTTTPSLLNKALTTRIGEAGKKLKLF